MVSVLSCDARQRAIVASSLVRWFVFSRVIFILFLVLLFFVLICFTVSLPRQRKHERNRQAASNRRNTVPPIMSARSVGFI